MALHWVWPAPGSPQVPEVAGEEGEPPQTRGAAHCHPPGVQVFPFGYLPAATHTPPTHGRPEGQSPSAAHGAQVPDVGEEATQTRDAAHGAPPGVQPAPRSPLPGGGVAVDVDINGQRDNNEHHGAEGVQLELLHGGAWAFLAPRRPVYLSGADPAVGIAAKPPPAQIEADPRGNSTSPLPRDGR